ncbi:MAG: type II secretion system protein, partial [Luteolibacter sp.]
PYIMKTHHLRAHRGFTLVELLVVIAIIAVLAGIGISAGGSALQKAKKTTCLAAATGIETAVNNYYTEYNSMPYKGSTGEVATTDEVVRTNVKDGIDLLEVLLGLEENSSEENSPALRLNPRNIKFLSAKEGKGKKNGLVYNSSSDASNNLGGSNTPDGSKVIGMFDPWGGAYNIIMDLNYDEKIENVKPKAATKAVTLNARRVAVWSDGADAVLESAIGKTTDDVKTWGQ